MLEAMAYASPFYGDRDFMMKAALEQKHFWHCGLLISSSVLQAVQNHGIALRYGSERIRSELSLNRI